MKRILACLSTALLALSASAATLVPIQLLNPVGSTAGQSIVSTGPSTAPSFANIVVANVTGAAALSGAIFTGASGLAYSNATFTLNDTSASNKAQVLFQKNGTSAWALSNSSATGALAVDRFVSGAYVDSPVSVSNSTGVVTFSDGLSATGLITPASTIGIKGTTSSSDNAQAGSTGEYVCAQVWNGGAPAGCTVNSTTPIPLTSGSAANITSLTLTAGDWDVGGWVGIVGASTTVIANAVGSTSSTSATNGGPGQYWHVIPGVTTSAATWELAVPTFRYRGPTTVYLVGFAAFTTSTTAATGIIWARRPR